MSIAARRLILPPGEQLASFRHFDVGGGAKSVGELLSIELCEHINEVSKLRLCRIDGSQRLAAMGSGSIPRFSQARLGGDKFQMIAIAVAHRVC
jgi:hypothetical protein